MVALPAEMGILSHPGSRSLAQSGLSMGRLALRIQGSVWGQPVVGSDYVCKFQLGQSPPTQPLDQASTRDTSPRTLQCLSDGLCSGWAVRGSLGSLLRGYRSPL